MLLGISIVVLSFIFPVVVNETRYPCPPSCDWRTTAAGVVIGIVVIVISL